MLSPSLYCVVLGVGASCLLGVGCSVDSSPFPADGSNAAAASDALAAILQGGQLVWQSNRENGRHEIYLRTLSSPMVTRLTHQGGSHPLWTADGRWIVYRNTSTLATHAMRPDGSGDKKIFDGYPLFALWDGRVLCSSSNTYYGPKDNSFFAVNADSAVTENLFSRHDFPALKGDNSGLYPGGITGDGRWMTAWVFGLFGHGFKAENGLFKAGHATVLIDLKDKKRIYYIGPGCMNATPPNGDLVYHVSREGATMPDIWSFKISERATRGYYRVELGNPNEDWGHEYMPRISNEGQILIYAASKGCHSFTTCDYEIFAHRLGASSKERTRLTFNSGNDSYPSLYVR